MGRRAGERIPLVWLLTPLVLSVVVGMAADVAGPKLITEHPLLQIALNPRNRYLLLASPQLGAAPFFLVGFVRLVLTDPLAFVLGRQHGEAAVRWAEDRLGDDVGVVRRIQGWFEKAAPLVIFVAPSAYWCLLAGAGRMRVRVFIALNVLGTIARLVLFRLAGAAFRDELEDMLGWVQRYGWWLVGISLLVVALQAWRGRGRGVLDTPAAIEAEITAEETRLAAEGEQDRSGR